MGVSTSNAFERFDITNTHRLSPRRRPGPILKWRRLRRTSIENRWTSIKIDPGRSLSSGAQRPGGRGDSGWMDIPLKENINPKVIPGPNSSLILPFIPLASGRPAATSFALCRRQNLPSGEVLGKKAISAVREWPRRNSRAWGSRVQPWSGGRSVRVRACCRCYIR